MKIEKLVNDLLIKHPKQIDFDEDKLNKTINRIALPLHSYYPPNEEEINNYNLSYQNWHNDIYELFSNYANKQNEYAQIFKFDMIINNNGNISAENLLLDFKILSGGQLVSPDFDDSMLVKRWVYPSPPNTPEGKLKSKIFSTMPNLTRIFNHDYEIYSPVLSNINTPHVRDKNKFYWKDGKPKKNTDYWRFECDEFRHKLDKEYFSYYLIFDNNSNKIVFQVRVSASNMSSPMEKLFILHKKEYFIEAKNDIKHLLQYGVPENVMQRIEGKNNKK